MSKKEKLSIEATFEELESIIGILANDETSLEDAMIQYEKGVGHLKNVEEMLSEAEEQIHMLDEKGALDEE